MNVYDMAIVGSGMGGSMVASMQSHKNVILFEKDSNLGGCAGTFKKRGRFYNAGATTFAGFEEGNFIQKVFKDKTLNIQKSSTAFRVIQKDKILDRKKDFKSFLEELNTVYPHKNNDYFWKTLYEIDKKFWQIKDIYYAKKSLTSYIKTLKTCTNLLKTFKLNLFKNSNDFIKETLGEISQDYQDFIDAGLLITVQSTSKDIPLLSLALGLCYPFHELYYVKGGMGKLFEALLENVTLKTNEEVLSIQKKNDKLTIYTQKDTYFAKKIILNSTIFNSANLFKEKKIKSFLNNFSFSDQGAFVVYMHVKNKVNFLHHYQVLLNDFLPNTFSKSFFVSISDIDDKILSCNGYSITISTHTRPSFWRNLSPKEYKEKKTFTQDFIKKEFLKHFKEVEEEDIEDIFSATPRTFLRFIQRENCGGTPLRLKTALQIPSCQTPLKDVFQIGDTTFAGQGWPGVGLGVKVLLEEI